MMEEDQEQRHLCKFCNKSFPCGRSLGGHMRSHMSNTSTKTKEKLDKKKVSVSSSFNGGSNTNNAYMVDFEAVGHAGYGLRENPKKTWRVSNSISGTLQQEKVCKQCGKGFKSWKALFGHMRCHSDREKISNSFDDDSWTGETQKLVMDSQSDNEALAPKRRKRSRRTRSKATITTTTTNTSTSVSEIEQEQEEVAMSLMMLSRDVGYWGGLNSVAETSDNHSVVVEVRSLGLDSNGDHQTVKKMIKPRDKKLDSIVDTENVRIERERSEFGGSNFGVLRNGFKKVESEVYVDGFIGEGKFKKPKLDVEAEFEVSDAELGKDSYNENRGKCLEAELGKDLIEEADDQADLECGKNNSSKRSRYDTGDLKLRGDSLKKILYGASDSPKKGKYLCTTCNRFFHTYQALGGHRASHKKVKGCFASKIENSENSIETDISPDLTNVSKVINKNPNEVGNTETSYGSKKTKHECPICFKVFTSGQALGGHKRSHVVESSEAKGSQTIVVQQKLPEICDLLDLNLPAPIEEDANSSIKFMPWWAGSNHNKHEPPVGLISN